MGLIGVLSVATKALLRALGGIAPLLLGAQTVSFGPLALCT